jgi:hypothetical protein
VPPVSGARAIDATLANRFGRRGGQFLQVLDEPSARGRRHSVLEDVLRRSSPRVRDSRSTPAPVFFASRLVKPSRDAAHRSRNQDFSDPYVLEMSMCEILQPLSGFGSGRENE